MEVNPIDWDGLKRLRDAFLRGSAGQAEYWQSQEDLAQYDSTFAQRIGWKWDYVLDELRQRGWSPPEGEVLDWGCGSGVAGRAFLDHFGTKERTSLLLWDRSPLAMEYARSKAASRFPELKIMTCKEACGTSGTLLLSHVLNELDDARVESLLELAKTAEAILWIEPGTHSDSRRLLRARERLRTAFGIVAPCPHQGTCGMLAQGNEAHWCHHFATPPPEVFTDRGWRAFSDVIGVDLRSLPLSYFVLDKRPVPELPSEQLRVVGRPRLYKGYALIFACRAGGVEECRLQKRTLPEAFRRLKKGEIHPLPDWQVEDGEIRAGSTSSVEKLPAP